MIETYKRLRKNPLKVIGKVEAFYPPPGYDVPPAPVVEGFFELVDGQGIPLDIVLQYFKDSGMYPCWLTFFRDTIEHGWNPKSTLTKIQVACEDVHHKIYADLVVKRLRECSGIEA